MAQVNENILSVTIYDILKQNEIPNSKINFERYHKLSDDRVLVLQDGRSILALFYQHKKYFYLYNPITGEKNCVLELTNEKSISRQLKNGDVVIGNFNMLYIFNTNFVEIERILPGVTNGRVLFTTIDGSMIASTTAFTRWCHEICDNYPRIELIVSIHQVHHSDVTIWTIDDHHTVFTYRGNKEYFEKRNMLEGSVLQTCWKDFTNQLEIWSGKDLVRETLTGRNGGFIIANSWNTVAYVYYDEVLIFNVRTKQVVARYPIPTGSFISFL